jgi:hypothetical protein
VQKSSKIPFFPVVVAKFKIFLHNTKKNPATPLIFAKILKNQKKLTKFLKFSKFLEIPSTILNIIVKPDINHNNTQISQMGSGCRQTSPFRLRFFELRPLEQTPSDSPLSNV